jgi:hypothetical protein
MQLAHPLLSSTLKTGSGYQVSTPAGTDDVVIQLNGIEVLRITLGTNMTIKTQGALRLEANSIELVSTTSVKAKAGTNLDLRASTTADLRASANLALSGGALVSVNGATVNVNNGALEVT